MRIKLVFLLLAISVFPSGFVSTVFGNGASFQGIGDLPGGRFYSIGLAISPDGSVVVGHSASGIAGHEPFRWTKANGIQPLGTLNGSTDNFAYAVSSEGTVVVGESYNSEGHEAFHWTEMGGMKGLGFLGSSHNSSAFGISADGSVVVGYSYTNRPEVFRWTTDEGMVRIGVDGLAFGVSDDGSILVGQSYLETQAFCRAFIWSEETGRQLLGLLRPDDSFSCANACSSDGIVVVGKSGGGGVGSQYLEAFRWTQSGGMEGLGDLAGGGLWSEALDVSADGRIIVGESDVGFGGGLYTAFIWDPVHKMRNLRDVLVNDFGLDLTGWTLHSAHGISYDGLTIAGWGRNPDGYQEAWIATLPKPAEPPVSDGDGPYTIFVGDTLTLDGSGSTDDDNDIVSYMWDLDDDGVFETDAGSQAVFNLDYAYLQSLGLLIDHTYNIRVKVTDSKGQSDIAGSTLIIVPKPAIQVAVDIKPSSCPNPVNVKSSGMLPIAILGTDDYDITTIDPTSIRLAGVEPLRSGYEDVAGPVTDTNDCNCSEAGPDGYLDLTLKFETQEIVEAIGDVNDGDILTLELTGVLFDPIPFETPIVGADCILIRGKHKPFNKADINKDGVVNNIDFALIAENWLESSSVE
jgi:probable HAF family extracellular repeat protein